MCGRMPEPESDIERSVAAHLSETIRKQDMAAELSRANRELQATQLTITSMSRKEASLGKRIAAARAGRPTSAMSLEDIERQHAHVVMRIATAREQEQREADVVKRLVRQQKAAVDGTGGAANGATGGGLGKIMARAQRGDYDNDGDSDGDGDGDGDWAEAIAPRAGFNGRRAPVDATEAVPEGLAVSDDAEEEHARLIQIGEMTPFGTILEAPTRANLREFRRQMAALPQASTSRVRINDRGGGDRVRRGKQSGKSGTIIPDHAAVYAARAAAAAAISEMDDGSSPQPPQAAASTVRPSGIPFSQTKEGIKRARSRSASSSVSSTARTQKRRRSLEQTAPRGKRVEPSAADDSFTLSSERDSSPVPVNSSTKKSRKAKGGQERSRKKKPPEDKQTPEALTNKKSDATGMVDCPCVFISSVLTKCYSFSIRWCLGMCMQECRVLMLVNVTSACNCRRSDRAMNRFLKRLSTRISTDA